IPGPGKNSTACSARYLWTNRRTFRSDIVTSEKEQLPARAVSGDEARRFLKKGVKRDVPRQAHDDQDGNHDRRNEPALHRTRPSLEFFGIRVHRPASAASASGLAQSASPRRFALGSNARRYARIR